MEEASNGFGKRRLQLKYRYASLEAIKKNENVLYSNNFESIINYRDRSDIEPFTEEDNRVPKYMERRMNAVKKDRHVLESYLPKNEKHLECTKYLER